MIRKTLSTICCMVLVMGFVGLASGDSTQSLSVAHEFDDEGKARSADSTQQAVSPPQSPVTKQQVVATNAKRDQVQASQGISNDQPSPQSLEGGIKEVFSFLLPSKQDLEKAFNAESNYSGPKRSTNWRENGQ